MSETEVGLRGRETVIVHDLAHVLGKDSGLELCCEVASSYTNISLIWKQKSFTLAGQTNISVICLSSEGEQTNISVICSVVFHNIVCWL